MKKILSAILIIALVFSLGAANSLIPAFASSARPAYDPETNYEMRWAFDNDLEGWGKGDSTAGFSAAVTVDYNDAILSDGALMLTTTFSGTNNTNGPSIQIEFGDGLDMTEMNRLMFDFYYAPASRVGGSFTIRVDGWGGVDGKDAVFTRQIIGNSTTNSYTSTANNTGNSVAINPATNPGAPVGNTGYNRIPLILSFRNADSFGKDIFTRSKPYTLTRLRISIYGASGANALTYNGPLLIDNVTLTDFYQEITATPLDQSGSAIDIGPIDDDLAERLGGANDFALVDPNATARTKQLYAYLRAVGESEKALFGHQDDVTNKKSWPPSYVEASQYWHTPIYANASESDTKDITGSLPAIVGTDTLSLTGYQYPANAAIDPEYGDRVLGTAKSMLLAAQEGAIIELSAHMFNFDQVYNRGKLPNGEWDWGAIGRDDRSTWAWYNGTPGTGLVNRLIDGDLNEVFTDFLGLVARFAKLVNGELPIPGVEPVYGGVPIIFRPYHEYNGTWFWWGFTGATGGGNRITAADYKRLWQYTVEYLRDELDVHNFLYLYSPNAPSTANDTAYTNGWPGDEYVDIIGFDQYYDSPSATNKTTFMNNLRTQLTRLGNFAAEKDKPIVLAETGMRVYSTAVDPLSAGNHEGIGIFGNLHQDWFSEVCDIVAESNASYYMIWSNFGVDTGANFYMPYKVSDNRGHDMTDNFIAFYNDEKSIFADGTNFYDMTAGLPSIKALVSITGPDAVASGAGAEAVYTISAKRMPQVNAIELEFEVDGDFVSGKDFIPNSAFSIIGNGNYGTDIFWKNTGSTWTGKVTLLDMNMAGMNGDNDIIELVFNVNEGVLGTTEVKLNYIKMSYGGQTVDAQIVKGAAATILEQWYSPYDLNKDGVIDLNDLTYALQFLTAKAGDPNWDEAKAVDFEPDGEINIDDLILILANYTIPYYS